MAFKLNRSSKEPMSEINVTPFVDVMLVLLIIFMVTAPLLTVGVQVDLPESSADSLPEETEPLRMPIKKIGITNQKFKRKLILFSAEFNPKLGLRKEYNDKKIERNPNIKYRYCSDRNLTMDVPKILQEFQKVIFVLKSINHSLGI